MLVLLSSVTLHGPAGAASERDDAQQSFAMGVRLYEEGNYIDAIEAWRGALEKGYGSTELFVNLGNATYRAGELGWAIYYFEQARRLAPADPDVASNLALVRREALGREARGGSALLDRIAALQNRWTSAGIVWVVVVICWIAVALILISWQPIGAHRASYLRWGAVALITVSGLLVGVKAFQMSMAPDALAVRPISARSEPSEAATVEFRLPVGSPVGLGREAPGWREIVVSASLRGWVEEEALALFSSPETIPTSRAGLPGP